MLHWQTAALVRFQSVEEAPVVWYAVWYFQMVCSSIR